MPLWPVKTKNPLARHLILRLVLHPTALPMYLLSPSPSALISLTSKNVEHGDVSCPVVDLSDWSDAKASCKKAFRGSWVQTVLLVKRPPFRKINLEMY
jgi:hypothetical protein